MVNQIIKYFRCGLRKKLKRPNCGRYLSLWDDFEWKKSRIFSEIPYINLNEFLYFLYQTKYDLCCIEDRNGQIIYNAIDKFFYVLFDFETYFNVFISYGLYKSRTEVIKDVINFNQFKFLPRRLYNKHKLIESFHDLIKKTNEWEYWKKIIVVTYTKIVVTELSFEQAKISAPRYLQELIENVDKIFNKALEN